MGAPAVSSGERAVGTLVPEGGTADSLNQKSATLSSLQNTSLSPGMTNLVFFWRFEHITGYPRYHSCPTPLFTSNEFITIVLPVISGNYGKCHFHLRFWPMSEGTLGAPSLWLRRAANPQDCGIHTISIFSNPIAIDKVRTNTRQDCDDAQIPLSLQVRHCDRRHSWDLCPSNNSD